MILSGELLINGLNRLIRLEIQVFLEQNISYQLILKKNNCNVVFQKKCCKQVKNQQ